MLSDELEKSCLVESGKDAREIGYVLQKNPDRREHVKDLSFGKVHCLFTDFATRPRTENMLQWLQHDRQQFDEHGGGLLMDFSVVPVIDETKIVRGEGSYRSHPLEAFVNDTAFTFGTHTSTALLKLFPKVMGSGTGHALDSAKFVQSYSIKNVVLDGPQDVHFLTRFFSDIRDEEGLVEAYLAGRIIDYPMYQQAMLDIQDRCYIDYEYERPYHRMLAPIRMSEVIDRDHGDLPSHGIVDLELKFHGTLGEGLRLVYLLGHLLDKSKHYYMGSDEMERFDRFCRPVVDALILGKEGFGGNGLRGLVEDICYRFFPGHKDLARQAIESFKAKLSPQAEPLSDEATEELAEQGGPLTLHDRRHNAILDLLGKVKLPAPFSIVDAGCSTGQLLKKILTTFNTKGDEVALKSKEPNVFGIDPSMKNVAICRRKASKFMTCDVFQSSITMKDSRLAGNCDVLILSEVLEHVPLNKLQDAVDNIHWLAPDVVIVTTPNKAYNKVLHELYGGDRPMREFRHWDHRWEMAFGADDISPESFRDMMMAAPSEGPDKTPLFSGVSFGMIGDQHVIDGVSQGASFLFVFYTEHAAPFFKKESAILGINPSWK